MVSPTKKKIKQQRQIAKATAVIALIFLLSFSITMTIFYAVPYPPGFVLSSGTHAGTGKPTVATGKAIGYSILSGVIAVIVAPFAMSNANFIFL